MSLRVPEAVVSWGRRLIPSVVVVLALHLGWAQVAAIDLDLLGERLRRVPASTLVGIAGLALFAVLSMSLYDWLAARWLGSRVPLGLLLRFSWVANSVNNFIGFSGLAATGVRLILLTRAGATTQRAAVHAGLVMLAVPVGLSALALPALPYVLAGRLDDVVPRPLVLAVLLGFSALPLLFLLLARSRRLLHRVLPDAPPLGLGRGLAFIGVSVGDWLLAIAVAWACVSATGVAVEPADFVAVFALATALGILSLLPAGVGVFDVTLLFLLGGLGQAPENVTAGILLFRVTYFLVPWLIGVAIGADLMRRPGGSVPGGLARGDPVGAPAACLTLPVRSPAGRGAVPTRPTSRGTPSPSPEPPRSRRLGACPDVPGKAERP